MVGNVVFGYMGSDCGVYLCEEIVNFLKNVFKVIMFLLVMGLFIVFLFVVVLIYFIKDFLVVFGVGMFLLEIYY